MKDNYKFKLKLKTLLYISSLICRKYPSYFLPTYLYFLYRFSKKLKMSVCIIPCVNQLIEYYLTKFADNAFDENNCVVIPELHNKNLINNSFNLVRVNFKNNEQEFRIAHAIPIDNLQCDELLMSEGLFNNLSDNHEYLNNIRLYPINQKYIKIAQDVEISLINTEHEINHGMIDMLLKNYFKTPRILYKGDLFAVNIAKYAPDFICSSYELNFENLYFKCRKISTNSIEDSLSGYFCVMGESSLKQGPNIRGYLPISIFNFCNKDLLLNGGNYADCLISKCPRGLEDYLEKIDKAVRPFLQKNKLKLQPTFLLEGNKGVGKNVIIEALAAKIGMHIYKVECSDIQSNSSSHTETKLTQVFMKSKLTAPCFLVLNNFEIYGRDHENNYDPRLIYHFQQELKELFNNNNFPIILICLLNTKDISPDVSRIFLETFKIDPPNQGQRTSLLIWLMKSKSYTSEINLEDVAAKTPGFMLGDLDALLYHSMKNWFLEIDRNNKSVCLRKKDFEKSFDIMQKSYTSSIGAPKVPKVQWSDIGGLIGLKQEIMRTINLPLQHPKLLKIVGLKRSGILLFGPPGTGKTLIAKAVATECGLCFLSVKGPELLNMYVGQSEKNVRQVFERARDASPCIIFFDELDSLAPNRGISGDSGGVMDRVVSQLLSEMDGLTERGTVFVIGATNRPDLLDPALLRPGRFDKLLYVGPCGDIDSKFEVLKALTRKFILNNNVELTEIAKKCPNFITGADLYSVCANAWFSGVRKTIEDIENGVIENDEVSSKSVIVNMDDFTEAVKELKPSISEEDIKYFNMLNQSNNPENNKKDEVGKIEEFIKKDENEIVTDLKTDEKSVKRKTIKRTRNLK